MGPIASITLPYALALGLIATYWLLRIAREARARWVPHVAWWAVPGLTLLWATPLAEVPALFGVGAALLLLAEFWPGAFRPSRERPGWAWPLLGLGLGLALLGSAAWQGSGEETVLGLALASVLAGLGGLLSAALYRGPVRRVPDLELRFAPVKSPDWPDFSLTLTERGAQLLNVSGQALHLAGWSPSGVNAWLHVRGQDGLRLNTLGQGQSVTLPLNSHQGGVRVWYLPLNSPGEPRLFRADWTPPAYADTRVLN